jgi:hypothetical protein
MNPKTPSQFEGQGSFFEEEAHGNMRHLEAVPDGVFPEPERPEDFAKKFADEDIARSVHESVVSDRRKAAQIGKHSPLQREGSYSSVRPGDVLPGFGVVTYRNLSRAEEHAARLDAERGK